jgi:hypothetical protein
VSMIIVLGVRINLPIDLSTSASNLVQIDFSYSSVKLLFSSDYVKIC